MTGTLLIVLVLTQEASQPETRAFAAAALEVLGASAEVRVVEVPADLTDQKVVEHATVAGADGTIELSWTDSRSRALVHCYVAEEQRWVDRSITFGQDEDESERGRMLGYAVASMFLSEAPHEVAEAPASSESSREQPPAAAQPVDSRPVVLAAAPEDSAASPPSHESSSARDNWRAFDFGGLVSHGLGGEADAMGVTAALRLLAVRPVWARVGVGGRTGEIPAAQANMKTLQASAGAAWSLFDNARFSSMLRGDLIGSWLEVGHLSPDDSDVVRQHRWLFGSDAVVTGALRLSAGASLFAGGGLEVMFGGTDIYTHGVRVATIPPLRLIAEFGLQSEF
jgi:hypothetical protein